MDQPPVPTTDTVPATEAPATEAPASGPRWTSIEYKAERKVFRGIMLRETLLVAATLGVYWFWARTRVRRFMWANTSINGTPLEYSGRGIELFIGFVVASVIVGGLYWATNLIALTSTDPTQSAVISGIAVGLLFSVLSAIAIYRTRRYMVRRTTWRGIRGGMTGSTWGFVGKAILPALVTALTLGIAYPWLSVVAQRYLINNMSLGSAQFRYEGRAGELIWTWIGCVLLYPFTLGLSIVWWSGHIAKYHYNAIHLDSLHLHSELRPMRVVGIYFIGYLIASLIMYPIFAAMIGIGALVPGLEESPILLGIAAVIGFTVFFALSWGLYLYFVNYQIVEHYLTTLTIKGSLDWSKIEQVHDADHGPGDGLDAVLSMDGI